MTTSHPIRAGLGRISSAEAGSTWQADARRAMVPDQGQSRRFGGVAGGRTGGSFTTVSRRTAEK